MKILTRTQFGNPILRKKAKPVSQDDIKSLAFKELVENMRFTLLDKKLGIGLAATQVNVDLAVAIIAIRPTTHRPEVKEFDLTLINPHIVHRSEATEEMWEGCISAGSNGKCDLFAKVARHTEIKISYTDQDGKSHARKFTGLRAQVIQHEVDHLNGILFVDRVSDPTSFMTSKEYTNRIKNK